MIPLTPFLSLLDFLRLLSFDEEMWMKTAGHSALLRQWLSQMES
jgi:hypothetical protein